MQNSNSKKLIVCSLFAVFPFISFAQDAATNTPPLASSTEPISQSQPTTINLVSGRILVGNESGVATPSPLIYVKDSGVFSVGYNDSNVLAAAGLLDLNGIARFATDTVTIFAPAGLNIIGSGCFAINGTCLSTSTFVSSTPAQNYQHAAQIYAWGDSITRGNTTHGGSWVGMLEEATEIRIINKGIGGDSSTGIANRMITTPTSGDFPAIIWAGRNSINTPALVVSEIDRMVAHLKHGNYVVLSILNGAGEGVGTENYQTIKSINDQLKQKHGDKFLDIRAHLIAKNDPNNTQDVQDAAADIVPTSLRFDFIHPNLKGNQYIAEFLRSKLDTITNIQDAASKIPSVTSLNKKSVSFAGDSLNFGRNLLITYDDLNFMNASSGPNNLNIGLNSLVSNTLGRVNAAFGNNALARNTTGTNNVAIGNQALMFNTTASNNTGIGASALQANTTGSSNLAIGGLTLSRNTTGLDNLALGGYAMFANTTGGGNFAIGNYSLSTGTSTSNNTAIGHMNLRFLETGSANLAIGYKVAQALKTGSNNVLIGSNIVTPTSLSNVLNIGNILYGDLLKRKVSIGTSTQIHTLDINGPVGVGSSAQPTGITLYDKTTKTPVCVEIASGQLITTAGFCK
jgi:hypothetical protein